MVGARADSNHEMLGADPFGRPLGSFDLDGVLIDKAGVTFQHLDPVAVVEALSHVSLPIDHGGSRVDQVRESRRRFAHGLSEQGIPPVVGDLLDRVTQCL